MNLQREITFADLRGLLGRVKPQGARPRKKGAATRDRVLHQELVGLKIGASQIAAAHVVNNGAPEVVRVAREPLPRGIVTAGELTNPDGLASALAAFFADTELPRRPVRLGVASNRIGLRAFDLTDVPDEAQLENAVRFRAQDLLPIPLEHAVLDYHVLSESFDDEGKKTWRILLVVTHRDLVDPYVAACDQAGVELVAIDLEAFALLRALAPPKQPDAGAPAAAVVAVAIGHERSTLAVADGRVCEFARVLNWGGATLNAAIASAISVTPAEAETIKRSLSLSDGSAAAAVTPEQARGAADAVRRQLQGFVRELVSSLHFYQSQPGSLPLGEIVITGGTANLAGLDGELQRLLSVPVRVADPLARAKARPQVDSNEASSLAIAVGLGIED